MTEEPKAGVLSPTDGLLEFAANQDAQLPGSLDGADVSAASLGSRTTGQRWWDQGRAGLQLGNRLLSGASLCQANLSRANLETAKLIAIKGVGVNLQGACLEGTDLTDADLIGANLSAADAGEADFTRAMLEDADLHSAQLRFATFREAILDGANLAGADLWGAQLSNVTAERANFQKARLDESFLGEAELAAADFTGATLRRTDLRKARMRGAILREAVLDGADLSEADLSGATLANVSLATCNLTRTRFAGAWLERTRLQAKQLGDQIGEEAAGDLEGALESYIVLERNFLSLGSSEDARWAYRRKRRVGRSLHARRSRAALKARKWKAAFTSGSQWIGDVLAEWLCDYGESLGRVVRAFFTLLVCFALLYWVTGSLRLREGFHSSRAFTAVNYLLFSLDSMTTVGTSDIAFRAAGELGMLLSSLQTVLGTTLLGLFGFVLGARIRK